MLLPFSTNQTDKDFDAIRLRLQNLIQSVFPEWTDFNVANFGNLLLELFSFVGDVLGFYQDSQSAQSRITTATQRRALLGLVKLLGYKPATASAAQAFVTISLATAPVGVATFPAGSVAQTNAVTTPTQYRLLTDAVIAAGAPTPTVTVLAENSTTNSDQFTSNGTANQQFVLTGAPFIDGSVTCVAGLDTYTEIDNFLSSLPTDKVFTAEVDNNDIATITFSNGVNGQIPSGTVTINYTTGGGTAGAVDADKLVVLQGTWVDSLGNALQPAVTNAQPSTPGGDRATVAQIKVLAPASIRAPTNCVAREDFEIHAQEVPGVARALMLTSNESSTVPENSGYLYPVPVGGGAPVQALQDAVLTQVTVTFPCTLTFQVYAMTPLYHPVDVLAVVFLRQGAVAATVRAAITAALTSWFAISNADGTPNLNIDFGANMLDANGHVSGEIALSDIFDVVRNVPGVRKVGATAGDFLLGGAQNDVALLPQEFPTLGVLTLINGDTSAPL